MSQSKLRFPRLGFDCSDCQDTGTSATPRLSGRPGAIDYAPCRWCNIAPGTGPHYRRGGSWGVLPTDGTRPRDMLDLTGGQS